MVAGSNNSGLTPNEVLYIGIITIGCTKLVARLAYSDIRKLAISKSYQGGKSLVHTFVMSKLPTTKPLRQVDIRRKFPENLKIDRTGLSRVIDSLERTGHLRELAEEDSSKLVPKPRGHPEKYAEDSASLSGPKVYFETGKLEKFLDAILAKKQVLDLTYSLLFESGALLFYEKFCLLFIYYNIKNFDRDTAWERCKSIFYLDRTEADFDKAYDKIKRFKEAELNLIAEMNSIVTLEKAMPSKYIILFKQGARYFGIPVEALRRRH